MGYEIDSHKSFWDYRMLKKREEEQKALAASNERSQRYGLTLTEAEAEELILCRNESLKRYRRIEFGPGILSQLVDRFCDSQYLVQENYCEALERFQDIFYEFKNRSEDKLTDEELLTFMKEQFETVCFGDVDYLEETCLERFAKAVRSGYRGYVETGGQGEYERVSEEQRWDKNLYYEVLKEMF